MHDVEKVMSALGHRSVDKPSRLLYANVNKFSKHATQQCRGENNPVVVSLDVFARQPAALRWGGASFFSVAQKKETPSPQNELLQTEPPEVSTATHWTEGFLRSLHGLGVAHCMEAMPARRLHGFTIVLVKRRVVQQLYADATLVLFILVVVSCLDSGGGASGTTSRDVPACHFLHVCCTRISLRLLTREHAASPRNEL